MNKNAYLKSSKKPKMKFFCKHSQRPKAANYFQKIAPPQAFHWGVNAPPEQIYIYVYIYIYIYIYNKYVYRCNMYIWYTFL